MSQLADDEVLCTLALPLPLTLAGALIQAIGEVAEAAGYENARLLTDGSNRIIATKKATPDDVPCEGRCHHCGAAEDEPCLTESCPCYPWSVSDGPTS